MQPSSSYARTAQRRQDDTPEAPSTRATDMEQQVASQQNQTRSASGTSTTSRMPSSRSSNPDKQISQIEKSVTHLLVATKQLLETLTQWSRGNAQEEEVSDVYVRLGYEFNLACRAFNSIGVETTDLGPVPDLLRTILEDTLSQPASPQALDNYLPRIRDIIINLLQGLKRKQGKLRTKPKDGIDGGTSTIAAQIPSRQGSLASDLTGSTAVDSGAVQPPVRNDSRRDSPVSLDQLNGPTQDTLPPPTTSGIERRTSIRRSVRREPRQQIPSSDTSSTLSSTTAQNIPIIAPPSLSDADVAASFPHAPPPPPKQDALTALSRGGDLERRASRRFSAYQIQKHLGASPNGVPVIPAAQNSPIPNRGREARESMRAVTSRTSFQAARQKSSASKLNDSSPNRAGNKGIGTISEEKEEPLNLDTQNIPKVETPNNQALEGSPISKTPDEFKAPVSEYPLDPAPELGATVNGPLSPIKEIPALTANDNTQQHTSAYNTVTDSPIKEQLPPLSDLRSSVTPPPTAALELDSSPASAKELTLFLQYKTRVKKFILPIGDDLTLARLQLAFIEKFAWTTHNNGVDLPEIYIQDPVSGVRHELEDLADVKDRSVLVLNFEVLDEVKKHFDEGIGGLRSTLDGVRSLLDGQSTMMQRFADRQLEASKDMARLSAAPSTRSTRAPTMEFDQIGGTAAPASEAQILELQNLRRDIAVLRQTYSAMSQDFEASMKDIKTKAANVKSAAQNATAPVYEGSAGRVHVNEGKKTLTNDSEALVNRVDNLTDTVEDLRKDVVSRGVRPKPQDLEILSKEISSVSKDLQRVKEFMKREKPVWTKIWEQELNLVCTERDELTQQEDLMHDLYGDLEDVQNVFNLVEEAMKQQNLTGGPGSLRQTSRNIEIDPTVDPGQAKEGVLDEVRALRPNHESRLEAIERAEKSRQRDLESRKGNEFQREIEQFVDESKLKKTGGMEEVERLRQLKDKQAFRENWETQQAIEAEKARKKAERDAKKAAAAAAAVAMPEAGQEQPNGEVVASEPTDNTADTPAEGEGAFKTAPTGTPATEIEQPALSKTPPLLPDVGLAAPQLPEVELGDGNTNDEKSKDTSNSWWKPAIF